MNLQLKTVDWWKELQELEVCFLKQKTQIAQKSGTKKHLGFDTDTYGCTFWWKDKDGNDCSTQWSPFAADTKYYEPSKKDFMFNYRVENLKPFIGKTTFRPILTKSIQNPQLHLLAYTF